MAILDRLVDATRPKPSRGTVARGLYEIDKLGGPTGKTEMDFVRAMNQQPVAINEMPFGQRLLQWTSGTYNLQRIAVLFSPDHVFVSISSRYQV